MGFTIPISVAMVAIAYTVHTASQGGGVGAGGIAERAVSEVPLFIVWRLRSV
jgi:hypothetical protein